MLRAAILTWIGPERIACPRNPRCLCASVVTLGGIAIAAIVRIGTV